MTNILFYSKEDFINLVSKSMANEEMRESLKTELIDFKSKVKTIIFITNVLIN